MTVDKPPLALWVQALSARVVRLHLAEHPRAAGADGRRDASRWSTTSTRRAFGRAAGFVAGLVLALTPITVAISRHNNPDALLVLCCVAALWCAGARARGRPHALARARRASASASASRRRWAPPCWSCRRSSRPGCGSRRAAASRRCASCSPAARRWSVVGGAWPLLMGLTPAASRPWISGTSDNSIWSLIFGYNGLGRLDGQAGGPAERGRRRAGRRRRTTFGGASRRRCACSTTASAGRPAGCSGFALVGDDRARGRHAPAARATPAPAG